MPICRLCLKDKPLIKKSHIIPDFMYQNVFKKGSKMEIFAPKDVLDEILGGEKAKMKLAPTGEYEGNILCSDCDNNVLGKYESYASKTIYAGLGEIPASMAPICENWRDGEFMWSHCRNVDYQKYKLFLLSILWKASVSSRPFFSEVNLGTHEELIRRMIMDDDPKTVFDYSIIMGSFVPDKSAWPLVVQPVKRQIGNGIEAYQFVIDKSIFIFCMSSEQHKLDSGFSTFTVTPSNELIIFHLPPGTANNFLMRHAGVIKNNGPIK